MGCQTGQNQYCLEDKQHVRVRFHKKGHKNVLFDDMLDLYGACY